MKKNLLTSLVFFASLFFAGCALPPPLASGAMEVSRSHVSFEIEVGFRQAYRQTLKNMRACYEAGAFPVLGAPTVVEGDLADDNKSATVSQIYVPWSGRQVFRVVKLKELTSNRTHLEVFDRYRPLEGEKEALVANFVNWMNGHTSCSP